MDISYIDFHAHILPNADHGSSGLEMSLTQLNMAHTAGVGTIVATPHFYPDRHDINDFLARREEAFIALCEANRTGIKIVLGTEILLCEGLANLEQLDQLASAGTTVVLVEMPDPPWSRRLIEALLRVREERGFLQVLAHVDRYPAKDIEMLFSYGLTGQVNAGAICSIFTRYKILSWCEQGHIDALGSDIHRLSDAYQYYGRAMRVLGEDGQRLQNKMEQLLDICL